jgi:hypothetical protein
VEHMSVLPAGGRLLIGAVITGAAKDSQTCRSAIDLCGSEHDIALIVVRGRINTTGCAAAGVDLRQLRHEVDMANRFRARRLCIAAGLEGRFTVAMVDRATPTACITAAQTIRCDVLLVPDRATRLRHRAFTRAARREELELLAVP